MFSPSPSSSEEKEQQIGPLSPSSMIQQQVTSPSSFSKQQIGPLSPLSVIRQQVTSPSSFSMVNIQQHALLSSINDEHITKTLSSFTNKPEDESSSRSEALSSSVSCSNICVLRFTDISRSHDEGPTQPKLVSYPINKDKRCFRSKWFSAFVWLEYSVEKDLSFCFYCRHFLNGSNLSNRDQSDAFLVGFSRWKRAFCKKQGFLRHQTSRCHIIAEKNYKEYLLRRESSSSVVHVMDKSRQEAIKNNRQKLMKIVCLLHLCARQMIALRGHDESEGSSNRGNFLELLRWAATDDPIAATILDESAKNSNYLSPLIQNELIGLMATHIRKKISEKIKGRFFSLMADETRDISGKEQLSIVVRVVDPNVNMNEGQSEQSPVKEFFLGFIKLDDFDAESLTHEIVRFLLSVNIDIQNCIAICFDGASVMSGRHAGVQALLRQRYIPNAIYVHCYAHKLNLVICDITKGVPYLSEFYSIISKINRYFNQSSVCNETFKHVQQQLKLDCSKQCITTIKTWAETRWDSRWTSIHSIIENYQALILSLDELENESTERSIDARGLLLSLKESLFIVTIFILHCILGKIKILSDQLKSKSLDFGTAHKLISNVMNEIDALRNEQEFSKIFDRITEFCTSNNIELGVNRKEKRLKTTSTRFKDFLVTSTIGERENIDTQSKYRTFIFYPVIDSILVEMRYRFSTTNIDILRGVSSLSPEAATFLKLEELKPLCIMLHQDAVLLNNEIEVLKPMLKKSKSKNVIDLYYETLPFHQAFPTTLLLLTGAITLPVSSTTTERTFSKMKLIKTTARNRKPLLVVDDYTFKLNKATTTTKYWICTINGCAAKVHTDSNNRLTKTVDNHNHLREKEKLEVRERITF
ncbi:unnamed protein product [Rotaria sp. Silwood2]|nr:unnamed protein product [Rotaria sp. Silwood2]CAF4158119.1 unnamed protein product [Rotaria sp. Silwood2]